MSDTLNPTIVLDVPRVGRAADNLPSEFDFANMLADELPPIRTCGSTWRSYRDGAWSEIDRATLRPAAQNILPPSIRTARREATLLDHLEGRLQTDAKNFTGFCKFNADDEILLNCANGVVAISEKETRLDPHSSHHLFTQRIAANFSTDAMPKLFLETLADVLPDAEDRFLYQLSAGNFLFPDCRYESALVSYGEAGRCKSTVAEPIADALGTALVPRLTMGQICDAKSYHVPKLQFAAVNLGTEMDAIELGDSAAFKAIVSGEPVEARPIYGAPFTMRTNCKLWFLANCLPRFKHGTEAELRRTRFLRFDYLPPVKDVTLKARLKAERDAVFFWMLDGLSQLLTMREIPLGGQESRSVHSRFKVSNDPVGTFVTERCELAPEARVAKDDLRDAYAEFCESQNLRDGIGGCFFRSLYERWPALRETRPEADGPRRRYIAGITLKP